MSIDFVIRNDMDTFGVGIWIVERDIHGRIARVAKPVILEFVERDPGNCVPGASISLPDGDSHSLIEKFMTAAREAGFGRDKVSVESGELKATKEHLKDMQRLVFGKDEK